MGINYRQRQRRALRSAAAQSKRTGTRLEQPVPCALGDHKVIIALHPDGSLLSIRSECYDSPPSPEERAIVASLLGSGKFITCADTVRHVLSQIGGGKHIEPGEGFPRSPREMYADAGAHSLNTLIANLRTTSKPYGHGDPYPAKRFRKDHQDAVLDKLSQEASEDADTKPRWLGHIAGVETRVRVLDASKKLMVEARAVKATYFQPVATYLGKGHFQVNFKGLAMAARGVPQHYGRSRSACRVCARNFSSVKAHVQSDRHRQRFESVVFDNLITLGSRLHRNR